MFDLENEGQREEKHNLYRSIVHVIVYISEYFLILSI